MVMYVNTAAKKGRKLRRVIFEDIADFISGGATALKAGQLLTKHGA
jgi:hypothetical protein